MSLSIRSGGILVMGPSNKRVILFDWGAEALPAGVTIANNVFTITPIKKLGVTALSKASETTAARSAQLQLDATTATVGDKYSLSSRIQTSENPVQILERAITVLIQNQ